MSLKFNIFPNPTSPLEVNYFLSAAGLDRWDWEHPDYANSEIDEMLAQYIYRKADGQTTLNDLLVGFIRTKLKLNPRDFAALDYSDIMNGGDED